MKTAIKWVVIVAVAWIAWRWLTGAYSKGPVTVGGGTGIVGRGWAPPANGGLFGAFPVRAWAPPNGIIHAGGGFS